MSNMFLWWAGPCTCPPAVLSLRAALTSLLILEAKAIVWYQANVAAYVYYITERLDIAYRTHLSVASGLGSHSSGREQADLLNADIGMKSNISSSSATSSDRGIESLPELTTAVRHEVERLQQALFAIPENDCGKKPECYATAPGGNSAK